MDYAAILTEAHNAAKEAVAEATTRYDEMAGACGFAWVTIDGQDGLARWCRKQIKDSDIARANEVARLIARKEPSVAANSAHRERIQGYGDKGYPKGWQFWNPGNHNGQRVDIKEAGARAFMHALARHGIRADTGSRLD